MRKCLPFFFVLISLAGFAQKPQELFDQAMDHYRDEEYDSALLIFEKIYKKGRGDESLIAKAFYNMGHIYMLKEDHQKAKEVFESLLDGNYDEKDKGGRGEGIMAEPYALYKNNSCKNLAEIAISEKQYARALNYTELFDKVYPYQHFCGNEYAANDIYVAYTYARCYDGLDKTKKAIETLLPQVMYNGLAGNHYLVELADSLIRKQYSAAEICKELADATLKISKKKREINGRQYDYYSTFFFDTEIEIFGYAENWKETRSLKLKDLELYQYNFTNSSFYKMLEKQDQLSASFSLIK